MRQYLDQISAELIVDTALNVPPLGVGIAGAPKDERKTVIRLPNKRVCEWSLKGKSNQVEPDFQLFEFFSRRLQGVLKRDAVSRLALLG
jgi:hypothetical protein